MKKIFLIITALLFFCTLTYAGKVIVDKYGTGHKTIQEGIYFAKEYLNDTVIVYPGTYSEQLTLNKNIVVQGSGYENTIIVGSYDPILTMETGIIKWVTITSLLGDGILLSGGTVANCVINSCAKCGIKSLTGTAIVINCVLVKNGEFGVIAAQTGTSDGAYVINCIGYKNVGAAFVGVWYSYSKFGNMHVSNSYGSFQDVKTSNQNISGNDPAFISSSDFHIATSSPCKNLGNTSIFDPDGSISDMGYFGGTDCPIYPVVYEMIITPNGNNKINIQAKARANY